MREVITARLSEDINNNLELVAKTEHLDKSTVMRRLLDGAIKEWKLNKALDKYRMGDFSAEQSSKFAEISMWRFFDILKERGIHINYDAEEFRKDIKTINKYFK